MSDERIIINNERRAIYYERLANNKERGAIKINKKKRGAIKERRTIKVIIIEKERGAIKERRTNKT